MAEKDNLRLEEFFGVAQPRKTGGRGSAATYKEPVPLIPPVQLSEPRNPIKQQEKLDETKRLIEQARQESQVALPSSATPQNFNDYFLAIKQDFEKTGNKDLAEKRLRGLYAVYPEQVLAEQAAASQRIQSSPDPTRQEYTVGGRQTGIFFNPQEGKGASATRALNINYGELPRTAAGVQEGANALYDLAQFNQAQGQRMTQEYQMGRPTSLTGLPNTQGFTLGVGPSIFQQYTPPSGGAVLGRSDRAVALERNRQEIEQSRVNRMSGPERQQYMARQAAMMGMREQAMAQQSEQANREAVLEQERIKARGGVEAAQAGKLTPEQQMSEAQRERESLERIESGKVSAQYAENYAKQSGPERVNAYTKKLNIFSNAMKTFVDQQALNSKLDPASIENFKLIQGQMSSSAWEDFEAALAEDLDKDAALFKEFEDVRKKSATERANWMSARFNQHLTSAFSF